MGTENKKNEKKLAKKPELDVLSLVSKDELVKKVDVLNKQIEEYDINLFEMRILLQSGKGLGDILNLKDLLTSFMAVCRERYSSINSTVLLIDRDDPDGVFFRVNSYFGIEDHFWNGQYDEETYRFKFPRKDGLLWHIIQQGEVFSVQNMQRRPRFAEAWRKWNLCVLNSDVWCPLIKKGEVLGILTLGPTLKGKQIPESEYGFLQDLASIAVTNIDSVIKYEKNETILRNVKILYNVHQQLAEVQNFKSLCQRSLTSAIESVNAQSGNLMLLNPENEKLEIKVVWGHGIPKDEITDINNGVKETRAFALGEGVAGRCAVEKRPIRENNRSKIEQGGGKTVYCILSVPLLHGQEVVGVINMTNKVKKNEKDEYTVDPVGRFTEDDETLVVGLADQAASNLHRAKLYSASITDKMTGLFNTPHFEFMFSKRFDLAHRDGYPLTLVVVDIDNFKQFNDSFGHKAGDKVLIEVAKMLRDTCHIEKDHMAFRYGGDEFCLIMPHTDAIEGYNILEEMRKKLANTKIPYQGKEMSVTLSIGLATMPKHGQTTKELFLAADEALYASKEAGRNKVTSYEIILEQKKKAS